ncbi:unnamed protein product [Candida verbasci]|uniref:Uncharacterized protein n=1 Tax=Candida verbasci TaxID=1227364 RepID=A0A9W4TTY8_9ASCO|nr:unnamed protein product [Candida verbasci]
MSHQTSKGEQFILIVTAIILPPLSIFFAKRYSLVNKEFWISVILTLIGHLPGVIFVLYYLLYIEFPKNRESYIRLNDEETGLTEEGEEAEEPQPPPESILAQHEQDLPTYEEIVKKDTAYDVKDHKVQH